MNINKFKIIGLSVGALFLAGCGPTVSQSSTGKLQEVTPKPVVSKDTINEIHSIADTLPSIKDNLTSKTDVIKSKINSSAVANTASEVLSSVKKSFGSAKIEESTDLDSLVMKKADSDIEDIEDDELLKLKADNSAIQIDIK